MNEYLAVGLGIVIGSIGATIYLGKQIKDLKNIILDKRTVVRFLKEALSEAKPPRKNYRKKYNGNGKSTRGMKTVNRKKSSKVG
jgi:hypothetical protein